MVFSICACEDTYAARLTWSCLPDRWMPLWSKVCFWTDEKNALFISLCTCVHICGYWALSKLYRTWFATNPQSELVTTNTVTIYMYIYIYISSWHAASTDFPDPLSPLVTLIYRSRQIIHATSCISTELLQIGFSLWPKLCSSVWGCQQKYIAYEFVLTSVAMSHMFCSSKFGNFLDGW